MKITGPNGTVVEVTEENRLQVKALTIHNDRHLNDGERYWSVYSLATTAAVDDYFFYLKNEGLKGLTITDVRISSSVALNTLYYEYVTGTASTGTDATVTSRNLGSPREITGIVQGDPDFTGLTKVGEIFFEKTTVADQMYSLKTTSNIIIPQGKAIAFRSALAAAVEAVVSVTEAE